MNRFTKIDLPLTLLLGGFALRGAARKGRKKEREGGFWEKSKSNDPKKVKLADLSKEQARQAEAGRSRQADSGQQAGRQTL